MRTFGGLTPMYMFDKAIDLTHELKNGMPIYPGDPSPSFEPAATLKKDGVNLTRMVLGSHTGTHMDAPKHFVEGGESIDSIPVTQLVGEALVLDFSSKPFGSGITSEELRQKLEGVAREGDIILCYTGCSAKWGDPSVNSNYTYLTPEGARYLVSIKARAFGIDFLSVEKFHAKSPDTHKQLLSHGVFIIESLSKELAQFLGKRILFISLPIKLSSGDGAPCRALAVPIS